MPKQKVFDIRPPQSKKEKKQKVEVKIRLASKKRKQREKIDVLKTKGFDLKRVSFSWLGQVFQKKFVLFLFFVFGLVFVFLHLGARIEIEVWPKTRTLFFEKEIVVDGQALRSNFVKAVIPGKIFSKEQTTSRDYQSTETGWSEGKAKGRIKVVNNYTLRQVLVQKTRFLSADGKLFYLTKGVEIPSGTSRMVTVVAAEAGPEYNIKPTKFSIPGLLGSPRYTAVYAESLEPMSGGYREQVKQVSKDDLQKAEDSLTNELTNALEQDLRTAAGSLFELPAGAFDHQLLERTFSAKEGDKVEKFSLTLSMASKGFGLKKEELEGLLNYLAKEMLEQDEEVKENGFAIELIVNKLDFENQKMFLRAKVSVDVLKKVDSQLLRKSLLGKSIEETENYLSSLSNVEKAKINVSPFWIQRIPQDPKRLDLKIKVD
jgi:hypothetical protein